MRRQEIQLLAVARQGDVAARCEVGRRYLSGTDGFPRHPPTGLSYLSHPSVACAPQASVIVAENMELDELLSMGQEQPLRRAAGLGCTTAQIKLATWTLIREGASGEGLSLLMAAKRAHSAAATKALAVLGSRSVEDCLAEVLAALLSSYPTCVYPLIVRAGREAHGKGDLLALLRCLRLASSTRDSPGPELAELSVAAALLAEHLGASALGLPPAWIEAQLEQASAAGCRAAGYVLGRALCEVACNTLPAATLAGHANVRKGAALLLRSADGGCEEAWMHLYRLHADNRSSVANLQMARFFLEKAALCGFSEAQRKLGALLLREAASLAESEAAIQWLSRAAGAGDLLAAGLLRTLVLPWPGSDEDAAAAIKVIQRSDPWLAVRLRLSRDFGLTKLEALTVDPAEGERPWGLVVGKNKFVAQARLAAPRAIPALDPASLTNLRRAALFFEQARGEPGGIEGDLRKRSFTQRRSFDRHGLLETMFFAQAASARLDALRQGSKWAFQTREPLRQALAA